MVQAAAGMFSVHDNETDWLNPNTGVSVNEYFAIWPALTVAL
jgi:hypothetical protein